MLAYLKTYGCVSLDDAPLNDVDRLVFAQMAYLNFTPDMPPRDASVCETARLVIFAADSPPSEERFSFQHKNDRALCELLCGCTRYSSIRYWDFVRSSDIDTQGQFAALTLRLPDGAALVAFRGTDNTLAGWKEDFDLAFKDEVPAQRMACAYAAHIGESFDALELCGHSKGGNLALYAAVRGDAVVTQRLRDALSFDGPGLSKAVVHSDAFARVHERLRVLIPHASLVGLLFHQPENVRVVHCSAPSLFQHYPYTWKTDGMDFCYADGVSRSSLMLGKSVCGMIEKLSLDTRERFVEAVYAVFSATGVQTITELTSDLIGHTPAVLRQLRQTDPESFRLLRPVIVAFWRSVAESLRTLLPENENHSGET